MASDWVHNIAVREMSLQATELASAIAYAEGERWLADSPNREDWIYLTRAGQVVAKAKRRVFTAAYKLRIVQEAEDAAATPGGVGALLRREGLYSSHLVSWRRERQAGSLEALTPRKRGRKSQRDPLAEENEKLRRQLGQLTEKLRKAEIIIDVQKKVAALLGRPIPDPEEKL